MTVTELIAQLQELAATHGGDTPVRVGCYSDDASKCEGAYFEEDEGEPFIMVSYSDIVDF